MTKKLLALLLCLSLTLSLFSACSLFAFGKSSEEEEYHSRKDKDDEDDEETEETEEATLPEQQELDDALMEEICQRTEMQLVAAAISNEAARMGYTDRSPSYYGNVDKDPEPELIYGSGALCFDISEGKTASVRYAPSGYSFFIDKDSNFYYSYAGLEISIKTPSGQYEYYEGQYCRTMFTADYSLQLGWADQTNNYVTPPISSGTDCLFFIDGEPVSTSEFESFWKEEQIQAVSDQSLPFVQYDYDGAYAQALVQLLDQYFTENCINYHGMFSKDIDDDGMEETLYLLADYMAPWFEDLNAKTDPMFKGLAEQTITIDRDRTGFVLVDPNGQQVQVRAHCTDNKVMTVDDAQLNVEDNILHLGNASTQMPLNPQDQDYVESLVETYISENGYKILQYVDLTDLENQEILCTYQKGSVLYIVILIIRDGYVYKAYEDVYSDCSYLVTKYEGKPALLTYHCEKGTAYENHFFKLISLNADGTATVVDEYDVISENGKISQEAFAEFKRRLEIYLRVIILVINDPYLIETTPLIPGQELTSEETQPEEELTPLEYWVENCHSMYFSEDYLDGFTAEDCRIARNAVYAHSGRKFQDDTLTAYFNGYDWYVGTIDPNSFNEDMLNDYQLENLNLIIAYESDMGYR